MGRSIVPSPLLLLLALWAGLPSGVAAQSQSTATVRGEVVDTSGAGIPGVAVRILHVPSGRERTVMTGADGRFLLLLLQPGGPYTLTADRLGYRTRSEEGIALQVGETHETTLTLEEEPILLPGVEVSVERGEIFDPSQVGPATLLNERAIQSLPVPSRDILDLTVLSPLVRTTEGGGFSIAGQNDRYNAILVDGIQNKDAFGLTPGGVPGGQAGAKLLPLDAVAQYEILVAPYDASLSGFAGGILNAVTQSGSNEWRVRAFAQGRHESLMGDLNLPTGSAKASGIGRALLGISAGGPLARDRGHIFVSGEVERKTQPPPGYNLGRDAPELVGILPEALEGFQELFRSAHGLETGTGGTFRLTQTLINLFARSDWTFSGRHRLSVRAVYAAADHEESPNRSPFGPYELSSNAISRSSGSTTVSAQLFSNLGSSLGNEIAFTFQRSSDGTSPESPFPQVEADLASPGQSLTVTRPVRAGAQFFAQENDLTQTSLRVSDNLTLVRGSSTWTMGVQGTWHGVSHRYLPGASGDWYFASWGDLLNNAPQRYQRTVLLEGGSPEVGFDVAEAGAFLQNQIDVGGGLTIRAGVRVDAPFVLDSPAVNQEILSFFGRSTGKLPSGSVLVSPRIGFNWQRSGRLRTQLRGGAGMFAGTLPHVWLSNAFQNTGLRAVTRLCEGRRTDDPIVGPTAPPFHPDTPLESCLFGRPQEVRAVTLFDPDFRYPQYLKLSATLDQEITEGISLSLGGLFTRSWNQLLLREINILPQEPVGPLRGYGGTARTYFGVPVDEGFRPIRLLPGYDQVLLAVNGKEDYSWSVSGEVRGMLRERLGFTAGYAYGRSYDRMSLTSVDLLSNFGFTPTHGDPNDPPLTPSNFDRPHKVVVALFGAPIPRLPDTEISLLYTGESGLPFSYVYRGDLNGDGYPFAGPAFDGNNDLLYVPESAIEIPSSVGTYTRMAAALLNDDCLREARGRFLTRNGCRAPWQSRLDMGASQTLRAAGVTIRLHADVINVLNLLNADWGLIQTIPPVAPLLAPKERIPGTADFLSEWAAGLLQYEESGGRVSTPDPWSAVSPDSQWQAQLGLRVVF